MSQLEAPVASAHDSSNGCSHCGSLRGSHHEHAHDPRPIEPAFDRQAEQTRRHSLAVKNPNDVSVGPANCTARRSRSKYIFRRFERRRNDY